MLQTVLVGQCGDVLCARLGPGVFCKRGFGEGLFDVTHRGLGGARTTPSAALALARPSSRAIIALSRVGLMACDRRLPVCNRSGSTVFQFSGLSASPPKQPHGASRAPERRRRCILIGFGVGCAVAAVTLDRVKATERVARQLQCGCYLEMESLHGRLGCILRGLQWAGGTKRRLGRRRRGGGRCQERLRVNCSGRYSVRG